MSWKYSSYTPRDHSSSREASQMKFGLSNSKLSCSPGDRWSSSTFGDSRFCRNSVEPVEHSPLWAKTRVVDNSASVQRLKERYNASDDSPRETKLYKKADTKDLISTKSQRQYGRSLTTAMLPEPPTNTSRFRRLPEKAPDPEKSRLPISPIEPPKLLYMPTATTKLFTRKYSNDLSPTTVNVVTKDRGVRNDPDHSDEQTITVVTRATSPTPTTFTVYLRSKRTDFGLEKKVPKPRRRPSQMADKEVQTDRESSLAKYAGFSDGGSRALWSSCGSKFSGKSNYECKSRLPVTDCRRSNSREDSASATTPEFPHKSSFVTRPPNSAKTPPTSPVKDSDKKTLFAKSPPAGTRPPLTSDCAKSELDRNPKPPTHLSSPLQCKATDAEALPNQAGGRSPTLTLDRCPDIAQTIEDVSSMSESSEDDTSSDEERNDPVPLAMAVKKSVTNFLQNIPNHFPQAPPQKANLKLEPGDRCWWTEDGVPKTKSTRSLASQDLQSPDGKSPTNFLSPPYLLNRQFSRDKDWLKGSCEDVGKRGGSPSPKDDLSPRTNPPSCPGLMNGEAFAKAHATGNCNSAVEFGEDGFNASGPVRRRDYSKSPEGFLAGDLNEEMKFNQQSGEYLRECGMKEKGQKLQNGVRSPLEEKGILDVGDMPGLISKAKAGLAKSKSKLDIKKSASRETSPKVTDTKSEIDLYWRELADSLTRPLKLCDLDFTDLTSDDETDLLTSSDTNPAVPPPPPMLILPVPPFTPPRNPAAPPSATPTHTSPRTRPSAPPPVPQPLKNKKTVKLFWKEVKDDLLHPKPPGGPSLIWDELPKVNVDMQKLEYLFESRAKDLLSKKHQDQNKNKEIIVLDPKRSNAINIGMTKLPPPRAIKAAILKMDATVVNKEGIDKLLAMLPTEEEKLRIQEAQNANPDTPLGSAEQFLITLASITELEARLRLWAFKLNFDNNEKEICEPLMDLKQGIDILRANKTFRSILATLLSVGNFLNGYDVKGFHIDYLAKVPEVKDTVHKHSLLHHLCLIVMDKFPDSTDLYSEIGAVTRASKVDFDELAANVKKVEEECKLSWNYLKMIAKHEGHTAMKVKMSDFLADCAERIIVVGIVHKRVMARFHKFCLWLGVPSNRMSTTRPNEIFKTISEFALEYRTTRDRILQQIKKMSREKTRTRNHLAHDSNDVLTTKMNSKEAKDDDRLKRLLQDDTTYSDAATWRRQRKDTRNLLLQEANNNDEEILDALIKTANQMSSPRFKERRRSRIYGKYYMFSISFPPTKQCTRPKPSRPSVRSSYISARSDGSGSSPIASPPHHQATSTKHPSRAIFIADNATNCTKIISLNNRKHMFLENPLNTSGNEIMGGNAAAVPPHVILPNHNKSQFKLYDFPSNVLRSLVSAKQWRSTTEHNSTVWNPFSRTNLHHPSQEGLCRKQQTNYNHSGFCLTMLNNKQTTHCCVHNPNQCAHPHLVVCCTFNERMLQLK